MSQAKERPLSPHLTIYKPQISSVLSIMHRATGVSNFIGMLCLLWWLIYTAYSHTHPGETWVWQLFSTWFGKVVLVAWSYGLFYHMCTGIRHLFWDAGKGFKVETMTLTGWIAVGASIALTVAAWSIALMVE